MKKYIVTWKSAEKSDGALYHKETIKQMEFEDILFKDFYVKATDDDTGEKLYIPYQRIYDIKQIGETEIDGDFDTKKDMFMP